VESSCCTSCSPLPSLLLPRSPPSLALAAPPSLLLPCSLARSLAVAAPLAARASLALSAPSLAFAGLQTTHPPFFPQILDAKIFRIQGERLRIQGEGVSHGELRKGRAGGELLLLLLRSLALAAPPALPSPCCFSLAAPPMLPRALPRCRCSSRCSSGSRAPSL
jgi:hypothetical protein